MIVAVVGSRSFTDQDIAYNVLDTLHEQFRFTGVVSGGARGADLLGKLWSQKNYLLYTEHRPDWERFGKPAGYIRNKLIIDDADVVVAFWNGKSKGTKHSINIAKKAGKKYLVWRIDNESKSETNI